VKISEKRLVRLEYKSYISRVVEKGGETPSNVKPRDMNKRVVKENTITILMWLFWIGLLFLLCVYVIPALIMGGFYLLLQILNYPFMALIVLINIGTWSFVIHHYNKVK